MEPEILIVRMRSGEDVISQVTTTDEGYLLKKPAMLVPAGKGNLGMLPWLMYGELPENGILIPKESTYFTFKPLKDLAEEYRMGFISNLVAPSKKIATPSSGLKLVTD
jgi:hypothetical protein